MITDEILLNNGYKKYPDSLNNSECLFQKRIKNDKGQTKYFIDIYKYVFKIDDYKPRYTIKLVTEKDNYGLEVTMYHIDDNMSLEEIEREVYSIWYGLDCKYYDCKVE